MGRQPLLILAAAAIAALGAWFAFGQTTGPEDEATRKDEIVASDTPEAADLTAVTGRTERAAMGASAGPTSWSVLAREFDGRAATEADIAASLGETTLFGKGTAAWPDVDPGIWRLRVTAPDGQVIERDVTVRPGIENKTYVRLGAPVRVKGIVSNTRGERLVSHLVCFLRPDEDVPRERNRLRGLVSGVTDVVGAFEVELPESGRWRPVVIHRGKVVSDGDFEIVEADGLDRRCDIVVPAKPRLVITMQDFEKSLEKPEIVAVSVYRPSTTAELEEMARYEEMMKNYVPPTVDDFDDEETKGEFLKGQEDAKKPEFIAQVERQKKWRTVVPEGWRSVGSSTMPESGRLVFDHLEHDREYRLALRRGNEVMRIEASVLVGYGEVLKVHLMPPAAVDDPDALTFLRVCSTAFESLGTDTQRAVPGATWTP